MSSNSENLTENADHTEKVYDELEKLICSVAAEEKELKVCN